MVVPLTYVVMTKTAGRFCSACHHPGPVCTEMTPAWMFQSTRLLSTSFAAFFIAATSLPWSSSVDSASASTFSGATRPRMRQLFDTLGEQVAGIQQVVNDLQGLSFVGLHFGIRHVHVWKMIDRRRQSARTPLTRRAFICPKATLRSYQSPVSLR